MTASEYLIIRKIIHKGDKDLLIGFTDNSEESLIEIMESYHKEASKELEEINSYIF